MGSVIRNEMFLTIQDVPSMNLMDLKSDVRDLRYQ